MDTLLEMRERLLMATKAGVAGPSLATLIANCDAKATELEETSKNWQMLERVRFEEERPEQDSPFAWFRDAIREEDRDKLLAVLKTRLDDLLGSMSHLVGALGTSFTPTPGQGFEAVTISHGSGGIRRLMIRGGPGTNLHFFRVLGDGPQAALKQISALGRLIDSQTRMQQLMFDCERASKTHVDFYVLLAAVFFSRGLVFETFDVASEGLRQLIGDEPLARRSSALIQTELELRYAQAIGFHTWSLMDFADLPLIQSRLQRALEMCEVVRRIEGGGVVPPYPQGLQADPRFLREIAAIHGEAAELGFTLGAPGDQPTGCLGETALFLAYARSAFENCDGNVQLRGYYVNTLLYALSSSDSDDSVSERVTLAAELESGESTDMNFADTLAWHWYKLALRERAAGRRRRFLRKAEIHVRNAQAALPSGHRYYTWLINRHAAVILGGAPVHIP